MALKPAHASASMEAGIPDCPRSRKNPDTPRGEDLRRAGGVNCGLRRLLVYSPLAFGPIQTPHWSWKFPRERIRRSGSRGGAWEGEFARANSGEFAAGAPASYNTLEIGSSFQRPSCRVVGSIPRQGAVSKISRVKCCPWQHQKRVQSSTVPEWWAPRRVPYRPGSHLIACSLYPRRDGRNRPG